MDGTRSWKGRMMGIFLSVVLVVGLMPSWAFAQEAQVTETPASTEQPAGEQSQQEAQEAALTEDAQLAEVTPLVPPQNSVAYQVPKFIDESHPEYGMTWSTKYCTDYTVLTPELKNWEDQWIVVTGDVKTSEIVVSGTVNLILTDGCSLEVHKNYKQAIRVPEDAVLNIYGQQAGTGNLKAKSNDYSAGIGGAKGEKNGAISIYGGTIDVQSFGMMQYDITGAGIGGGYGADGCNIAIYGGTVTATSQNGAGIGAGSTGNCDGIRIYGGSVYAKGGSSSASIGSGNGENATARNIYIYGGNIEADLDPSAASIGGGAYAKAENLFLLGGEVVAKTGSNSSGFGAGYSGSCDGIYISGGKYSCTAKSKSTGIGCGFKGSAKNIYISGGTINIVSEEEGAAIGCSYGGTAEGIYISGGNLNVTGGSCAAAIGGGKESSAKDVVISGGTVNATGGGKGAGIGGGFKGSCSDITISGDIVNATGGTEAAGIGGSYKTAVSNLTFAGGMVTATAGDYAAAIGGGKEGVVTGISFTGAAVHALCSKTGDPCIGSSTKGTATGITASGEGVRVLDLSNDTVVSTGGDFTSKMGNFDVAVTNGSIVAKGFTTTVDFSITVPSSSQDRIASMLSKVKVVPGGGFKLLEGQADFAAMVLGITDEEMTQIILDPDKWVEISMEVKVLVVDADVISLKSPYVEYGLTTIGTCVLHDGDKSTTVTKVIEPAAFAAAKGKLVVTLPVPDGTGPDFILHTSDDREVIYNCYTMEGDERFDYDIAAGTVTVTIDHCSHLMTSFAPEGGIPSTGDGSDTQALSLAGIALAAAAAASIALAASRRRREQ